MPLEQRPSRRPGQQAEGNQAADVRAREYRVTARPPATGARVLIFVQGLYDESGVVTSAMKKGVHRPGQNFYRFGAMGIFNLLGYFLSRDRLTTPKVMYKDQLAIFYREIGKCAAHEFM